MTLDISYRNLTQIGMQIPRCRIKWRPCKAMTVSQVFIFHFKCYSVLHFAVFRCHAGLSGFFITENMLSPTNLTLSNITMITTIVYNCSMIITAHGYNSTSENSVFCNFKIYFKMAASMEAAMFDLLI